MKATIVIAILLAGLGLGLAIRYNQNASGAQKDLDQERYLRMTAEENLEKATQKIHSLETEAQDVKQKLTQLQSDFETIKAAADDYKVRLDKAAEINKNFEDKIKELQNISAPQPVSP